MFENKNDNLVVGLPFGFRDIFPLESDERNNIKEIIRGEFKLWGYGEVKTPVVEFTKNISAGAGRNWKDKLVSFFDISGDLVSLRTDMTIPIARLTGMRIKKDQLPVRFYYFANSFRQAGMQKGIKREYNQAGLELIGSPGFKSDIEVLVILVRILKKLGVGGYKIGLGHIKLINGLCRWLGLNFQDMEYVKKNLVLKNFVAIEKLLDRIDNTKAKVFLKLINPEKDIGKIEHMISGIREREVHDGFNYLKRVYNDLEKLGYSKYLIIDLSIIREFEYYSGLLFEVYSSKTTDIAGSGGRYDGLIGKFGLDVPATGFALDVDLLHKSMEDSKLKLSGNKPKILLFSTTDDCYKLINISDILRNNGFVVEIIYNGGVDLENLAVEKRCSSIIMIDSGFENVTAIDLIKNKKQTKKLDNFLKEIKNE